MHSSRPNPNLKNVSHVTVYYNYDVIHRCVSAFGYTMDVMYFAWLDDAEPAKIDDAVELPQFKLREKVINDCCSAAYLAGNVRCLEIVCVCVLQVTSRAWRLWSCVLQVTSCAWR